MTLQRFVHSIAIAAPLFLGGAVLAQPASPPLTPDGEAPMDDPSLVSGCLQRAVALGVKLRSAPNTAGYFDWTLGTPLVTHNDEWGVVCRVDFIMAGADVAPRVNRLVMYQTGNRDDVMIAIGQEIAPLDSLPVETPISTH
jgi:hypothetical protein